MYQVHYRVRSFFQLPLLHGSFTCNTRQHLALYLVLYFSTIIYYTRYNNEYQALQIAILHGTCTCNTRQHLALCDISLLYQVHCRVPSLSTCHLTRHIYLQHTPASCSVPSFSTVPGTLRSTKLLSIDILYTWYGPFTCNTRKHLALYYLCILSTIQYQALPCELPNQPSQETYPPLCVHARTRPWRRQQQRCRSK